MVSKKDNIKSLFSNTRSRVIIIFTALTMLIAIIVGFAKFRNATTLDSGSSTISGSTGGIQSVPGSNDPTAQYAQLQQTQNVEEALNAIKTGDSSIPTIIRTQEFGDGIEAVGPQHGEGGLGFSSLERGDDSGPEQSLWIQNLKDSSCSKSAMANVISKGAGLSTLRKACSCLDLKENGYDLADLQTTCSCKELKAAGYNARELKNVGYSATRLQQCGFDACELRGAGFSAQQLKDANFSNGELKGAGFSNSAISQAGGLPNGITAADVRKAGCSAMALTKLREAGVSAAAIRRVSGCSASQLKAAGYNATELRDAGFSAAQLKNAGFSAAQLKNAGFSARDLLNAGFTPNELAGVGFTNSEIKSAEAELPPGVNIEDTKEAGCSKCFLESEREAGISSMLIHRYAACTAQELKGAGFDDSSLKRAGFSDKEISNSAKPIQNKISDNEISKDGCDIAKITKLREKGVSAERLKNINNCTLSELEEAGFNEKELATACFKPSQLLNKGFSPEKLKHIGLAPIANIASGRSANCSAASLEAAYKMGVSAATIRKTLGCSAQALKNAGYSAKQLRDAGFSAAELKNAGFSARALRDAGFSAKELEDAGFNSDQLKAAGFSDAQLKEAGVIKPKPISTKENNNSQSNTDGSSVASLQSPVDKENVPTLPSIFPSSGTSAEQAAQGAQRLKDVLAKQQERMDSQQYKQSIQQLSGKMMAAASQDLQDWKTISSQTYVSGNPHKEKPKPLVSVPSLSGEQNVSSMQTNSSQNPVSSKPIVQAGDVLFAVLDTSVNSDQPGPILATIVSGRLKGSKLIGSFNLPSNSDKMVINFNMMSTPGLDGTTSVSAYAIDPNTGRTALASRANHHYLMRYGSLFASTFLEGFGNAIQTANTTVTIGGTGAMTNTTIQNGVGRSTLENAVIGLATLGKSWAQVAQQQFNTPITVELSSGVGLGILFMQDVSLVRGG